MTVGTDALEAPPKDPLRETGPESPVSYLPETSPSSAAESLNSVTLWALPDQCARTRKAMRSMLVSLLHRFLIATEAEILGVSAIFNNELRRVAPAPFTFGPQN
jgi:hypothetical protein